MHYLFQEIQQTLWCTLTHLNDLSSLFSFFMLKGPKIATNMLSLLLQLQTKLDEDKVLILTKAAQTYNFKGV